MRIKIGNETFDSSRIPIAIVLSPDEKVQIYNGAQYSLLNRRKESMLFVKAPADVPNQVAIAWAMEAAPEIHFGKIQVLNLRKKAK